MNNTSKSTLNIHLCMDCILSVDVGVALSTRPVITSDVQHFLIIRISESMM